MIFTDLIRSQVTECTVMFGAGIALMIMYQIFKGTCGMLELTVSARTIAELIFWIGAGLITSKFLYYCAYGAVSFHSALAFTAGAILWKAFFYGIIDRIYLWIYMKQGKNKRHGEKEKKQPIQREQSGN